MRIKKNIVADQEDTSRPSRRSRPFPVFSLRQSLQIADAIADYNALKPFSRLSLADSIGKSPESSGFRALITSSSSYGLTEGGYQAPAISLTPLGLAIVAPKSDMEKRKALLDAAFSIELFGKLYKQYDQHKIPPPQLFKNILIRDFDVDPTLAEECLERFMNDGRFVGLIRPFSGAERVSIQHASEEAGALDYENREAEPADTGLFPSSEMDDEELTNRPVMPSKNPALTVQVRNDRVFITHGKNDKIVQQLKELLTFGKFTPVVAEEHETPSKPVPAKVFDEMRSCSAAIINVASEKDLKDDEGRMHHAINENVLIEIGAAYALYKGNFILLVQKGVDLPSNLQGLYRCDYEGDTLGYEATMKLLKAFNEFKLE